MSVKASKNDRNQVRARAKSTAPGPCGYCWRTKSALFGVPLICVGFGRDESGKMRVAKGIVAVGRFAVGVVAVGQVALGFLSVGQASFGVLALGQLAVGALVGFGQFSVGLFAVGQFVLGLYAAGQFGYARYLWTPTRTDMEAVAMFHTIKTVLTGRGPGGGQLAQWFMGLVRGLFSGV